MALILPKGIVVNSPQIEGDIERIDSEPLDEADIAKIWKVYTTTQRRLLDPTAERLENLWWRIWGSRKKSLRGATVARLFAQISDGQTFVPLKGPPNRHEGNAPLTINSRHGTGASSANNIQQPDVSRPSTTSSSVASRAPGPMPHPILKKTRGPSGTGPRPTARFISPHESQDEAEPASPISPNAHVTVQPPSPSPESQDSKADKKTAAVQTKKTFVASKKKRPVILRRQSSQTSQSSPEITTTAAVRSSGSGQSSSALQSSSERTPPAFAEPAGGKAQSKFREDFSPALKTSRGSAQSLKKPASRNTESKRLPQRRSASKGVARPSEAGPSSDQGSSKLNKAENLDETVEELSAEELEEQVAIQKLLLEEASARAQQTQATQTPSLLESASEGLRAFHSPLRSRSSVPHGAEGSGAIGLGLLQQEAKGITSAAPTFMDASGQVNLGSIGHHHNYASDASPSRRSDKGKGRDATETEQSTMFAKRPVQPVQVATSPEASGPLSRSKSQLTLLLEKDRERSSGKKSDKDRSSGKKR